MNLSSWLSALRARCVGSTSNVRRWNQTGCSDQVELSEPRCLPSVSVLVIGNTVEVTADGNDTVIVGSAAGILQIRDANGPLLSFGTVSSASVQSLIITGSDSDNVIDLSGVTAANFLSLTSISVEGNNGADVITGSPDLPNLLSGEDGTDTLISGNANDTLNGGDGADSITANAGDDSVRAGDGRDTVNGGAGNDTVDAGYGSDLVDVGADNDSVLGNNGEDTINGGTGNDTLNGDGGTDLLNGGDGNDVILGGELNDAIQGGNGDDTIDGQAGNDTITGDAGNDSLNGGSGNDSVNGSLGNDTLNGGAGNDTLTGDDGNDSILGGAGNDSAEGSGGNDTVLGQGNDDTLIGGGGGDNLNGGDGNDTLQSLSSGIVINDVTVGEGNSGTTDAIFSVGLTVASTNIVTVQYATSGGTATSGTDFTSTTGTLTFAPGVTLQTIVVPIIGDTSQEPAETFTLVLSNSVNATIIDNVGLGTITDNDAPAGATLSPAANVNSSRLAGNQDESAIAINPSNSQQMFTFANSGRGEMFAARSNDGGQTWLPSNGADFLIADGNDALPVACCDPTLAWDSFGNLFLVYIDDITTNTHVALSTNAGQTFSLFATLGNGTDQPTVVVGPGTGGVGSTVWVTYDEGGIQIRGAQVTGLGVIGAFSAPQATGVGQFGDIAIGPNGQVTVTGQSNTQMFFQTDPDGLGPQPLGVVGNLAVNVDTFDAVTPQPGRTIDAEAGLVYDRTGGPFNGRLYLLYTDEPVDESNNTEIFSRFSIDNGATWSAAVRVNDDPTTRAQIFSKIALDPTTGAIGAAWQDARNSAANTTVETFVSVSIDGGATWAANVRVSGGVTNGTVAATGGQQLGDYIGLAYSGGQLVPSWADNSNSTGDNPNGTLQQIDIYTARVTITINTAGGGSSGSVGTPLASVSDAGDTLTGGTGDDSLFGGGGDDFINAQAGNDLVNAGDGDDSVLGGAGSDTINGGFGDDTLQGQGGDDLLDGGEGDDTLEWFGLSDGDDTFVNANGFDSVNAFGTNGVNNFTIGQTAAKLLFIDEGGSTLTVGKTVINVNVNLLNGADTVTIGSLTNVSAMVLMVNGGDGNDTLSALGISTGNVRLGLNGEAGSDTLTGSVSNDTLDGGDGVDSSLGGLGNDTLLGGLGVDRLNGQEGDDLILGGDGNDVLNGFTGNDSISGDAGDDTIFGGDGNDTASGGVGSDSLLGEAGNDSLNGNSSNDTLNGGDGNDSIDGGTEADSITGDLGDDLIRGGHGADTIDGGDGNDSLIGGDGNDSINGGNGNDGINGGDGNDIINGGAGNDSMLGGDGADILLGGAGNDILLGGDGNDTINGQAGTDTIATGEGTDVNNDTTFVLNENFAFPASVLAALA